MSALATHVSTQADPHARGFELAHAHAAAVRITAATYLALFAAYGLPEHTVRGWADQAMVATARWAPALHAEILGIAARARLPEWKVGALNARTEILAAAGVPGDGECSTSVVLPADGSTPRTIQTWDWHDVLRSAPLGWTLRPAPGRWTATFTEAGIVGKIGVNSAGLGVHLNMLHHRGDSTDIGVPVHVVARRILDEAGSVAEAAALARSARLSASTALTIVTATQARCLELSPAGVGEIAPGPDGHLVHTNHFLDPALVPGDRADAGLPNSSARLSWLRQHRSGLAAENAGERAAALCAHTADGAPVCAHPDLTLPPPARSASLATIALDVAEPAVLVSVGGPCAVHPGSWQALRAADQAIRA